MSIYKSITNRLSNTYYKILDRLLGDFIANSVYKKHHIYGDASRVNISKTANVNNALFNVASGDIVVEDYAFCGHNVVLITGTHDYNKKGNDRQTTIPLTGRDIIIKSGVWIGSNSVILGPCMIGENAVIAAHSLVNKDVPPNTIVGGSPAKHLKTIAL
jgi:acetyltransferase-like isoleucine patch superfamily enzyme